MSDEIEAKFKVDDFADVRRELRQAGAVYLGTVIQTDRYYDTADKIFLSRDFGLRIRTVQCVKAGVDAVDTRPLLTVKGPARGGSAAKIRTEAQSRPDNLEAAMGMMEATGLVLAMSVQKRRESYRLGKSLVELDELPVIGLFVEIESPNERQLDNLRRRLGLKGPPITDHYVKLLTGAGPEHAERREFLL